MISHICTQPKYVVGGIGLDLAVSQERKSIMESVSDVVVFESGVLDTLEEVNRLCRKGSRLAKRCFENKS